jgi:hypothetical protein
MAMLVQRVATAFRNAGFLIREQVAYQEFSKRPLELVAHKAHQTIGVVVREGTEVSTNLDLLEVIGAQSYALRYRCNVLWYVTEYLLSPEALVQVKRWPFLKAVHSADVETNIHGLIIQDDSLPAAPPLVVHPIWPMRAERAPRTAFIIMPFRRLWSEPVYSAIRNACSLGGYKANRADELTGRWVMHDIWIGIQKAAVIIADATDKSPNVFYELGIAHTVGCPCILLTQKESDVPFDVTGMRLLMYRWEKPEDSNDLVHQLRDQLMALPP